jgi:hypothetical protein
MSCQFCLLRSERKCSYRVFYITDGDNDVEFFCYTAVDEWEFYQARCLLSVVTRQTVLASVLRFSHEKNDGTCMMRCRSGPRCERVVERTATRGGPPPQSWRISSRFSMELLGKGQHAINLMGPRIHAFRGRSQSAARPGF